MTTPSAADAAADAAAEHRLQVRFGRLHSKVPADGDACAAELAASGRRIVVVSACLLGEPVRWDGAARNHPRATLPLLADPSVELLPLCPELLGGMGCPRPAVHFAHGDGDAPDARVVDTAGRDRTAELRAGAVRADALATLAGASAALLKERSPSCGTTAVHGPAGPTAGSGMFAATLRRRGLALATEECAPSAPPVPDDASTRGPHAP